MTHDLFLAHATADRAQAERLYDLLAPDIRVWLATKSLMLGDDWTLEIPRAQRASMATVVLVSKSIDDAFYARDEVHTAIALHRAFPGEHRAVAVFLDSMPSDPMAVPFGLRGLHGLDARAEGGLEGVADRLRELVTALRARGGGAVALPMSQAAPAPTRGAAPLMGEALYDKLSKLTLGGQIDGVILRANLPRHHIRPATAAVAQRAIDIVHIVDDGGPELAARVTAAIAKEAPYLVDASAPVAPAPKAAPAPAERVSILLVFANPKGTDPLRLGAEERALRQSIQLASQRERLDIEALHAATIDDLRRALLAKPRTIVHFAGHGEADGLRFEDERGDVFVPDIGSLSSILQRRRVETVILNACYATSIIKDVPMGTRFTIAMEGRVDDAGAVEFSRGFYDVIGAGGGVEDAFAEGYDCARIKKLRVLAELVRA